MKRSEPVERVSEEFLDAVLSERSFYGPLIKSMAAEVRERRTEIAYLNRVIDRCYEEFDFGKFGVNPWAEDSDCERRFG